jgi:hypothetical protein
VACDWSHRVPALARAPHSAWGARLLGEAKGYGKAAAASTGARSAAKLWGRAKAAALSARFGLVSLEVGGWFR